MADTAANACNDPEEFIGMSEMLMAQVQAGSRSAVRVAREMEHFLSLPASRRHVDSPEFRIAKGRLKAFLIMREYETDMIRNQFGLDAVSSS